MKCRLTILVSAAILTACFGSNRRPIEITDSFDTRITVSGLKIFDYVALSGQDRFPPVKFGHEQPVDQNGGEDDDAHAREQAGGGKSSRISLKKFRSLSRELLEKRLAETGFCRDGHLILNSDVSRMAARIRGECVEAASDEDRVNFAGDMASPASTSLP